MVALRSIKHNGIKTYFFKNNKNVGFASKKSIKKVVKSNK